MDAKRRDGPWYGEVYRRANVQDVITLEEQPNINILPRDLMAHTRLYQVWNIDFEVVYTSAE